MDALNRPFGRHLCRKFAWNLPKTRRNILGAVAFLILLKILPFYPYLTLDSEHTKNQDSSAMPPYD